MNTPQPHDTHEIVIAATLWLMHRYQKTGCCRLARMIERHLARMHDRADCPHLADACRRLSFQWRAVSTATPMRLTHPILH